MNFGIDWSQPSTLRGAVTCISAGIAIAFIAAGNSEAGLSVMAVGKLAAGTLGVAVKD